MGNKIRLKLNSSTGATRGLLRFASDKVFFIKFPTQGYRLTANLLEYSAGWNFDNQSNLVAGSVAIKVRIETNR